MGRIVVAGGAGFLGSHLCDLLLGRGDEVVCIDNLSTGAAANVSHLLDVSGFEFVEADVTDTVAVDGPVTGVLNLASPASPKDYFAKPLETLQVGSVGTHNLLRLAHDKGARFLQASTSEVYGDPAVHPQVESYWGNVNPVGPRSVYDEAKRFGEALVASYERELGLDVRIARIFNTYGPRMQPDDGRVVSNFVIQALRGEPLTIYGDGSQTRSFCFVSDEVAGLLALFDSEARGPVNIGNPAEFTIAELADVVQAAVGVELPVTNLDLPIDDPTRRSPDITRAIEELGWSPTVDLTEGIRRTLDAFRVHIT